MFIKSDCRLGLWDLSWSQIMRDYRKLLCWETNGAMAKTCGKGVVGAARGWHKQRWQPESRLSAHGKVCTDCILLFPLFHTCVWCAYVCMSVHVHMCMCIQTRVQKLKVDIINLNCFCTLFLALPCTVSLLLSLLQDAVSALGCHSSLALAWLGSGDLDSVSLACTMNTLTAKHLSPQP